MGVYRRAVTFVHSLVSKNQTHELHVGGCLSFSHVFGRVCICGSTLSCNRILEARLHLNDHSLTLRGVQSNAVFLNSSKQKWFLVHNGVFTHFFPLHLLYHSDLGDLPVSMSVTQL